jgi:hypothetical protein
LLREQRSLDIYDLAPGAEKVSEAAQSNKKGAGFQE